MSDTDQCTKTLYSVQGAAKRIKVCEMTIRNWINRGTLSTVKSSHGHQMIEESALLARRAWMNKHSPERTRE